MQTGSMQEHAQKQDPKASASQTRQFPVQGMSCASCAAKVEHSLGALEGIQRAQVNFASEKVNVAYDPDRISPEQLADAVKRAGYTLIIQDGAASGEKEAAREEALVRTAWRRLVTSSILAGTIMLLMLVHMFLRPIPGYLAITAVLAAPIVLWIGRHVHLGAFRSLKNGSRMLKIRVTKVGDDTFLSQVIRMVEEAQGTKVPIQEFADRITGYFVPAILVLTALTFTSYLLFPEVHQAILEWGAGFLPWVNPGLSPLATAFVTATAVLVIACPCALGLGTPTALMVGSGVGAEKGILIRNGEAVQTLREVKAIAFDKTGTLTQGKPGVTDIIPCEGVSEQDLLETAASLEHASEHPLANTVLDFLLIPPSAAGT